MGTLDATIARLGQARASAIVRTHDHDLAQRALEAAVAGGFRSLEITLTTPGALELIGHFAREPELLVGAGTVLDVDQARAVVDAGGQFLVSPVADAPVAKVARELDVPLIAGANTPTELLAAHRMGAPLQKLFDRLCVSSDLKRFAAAPLTDKWIADARNAREAFAALPAAQTPIAERAASLRDIELDGDAEQLVRSLLRHHELACETKGASPWLALEGSAVRLLNGAYRPTSWADSHADAWVHGYYLPSLASVLRGLQPTMTKEGEQ